MPNFLFLLALLPLCIAEEQWQPVLEQNFESPKSYGIDQSFSSLVAQRYTPQASGNDQCALYKVGFSQDLYFQYIQYKIDMPELKEFTLCLWKKFTNHSNDHPLFSYAGKSMSIKFKYRFY